VGFVQIGLLDANVLPIDVQFFGDEHGERSLHALTDFRIFRRDGHKTIGMDLDEGRWRKGLVRGGRRLPQSTRNGIRIVAE
jgi:hypothetical protein